MFKPRFNMCWALPLKRSNLVSLEEAGKVAEEAHPKRPVVYRVRPAMMAASIKQR
jgi:hypothetical protein